MNVLVFTDCITLDASFISFRVIYLWFAEVTKGKEMFITKRKRIFVNMTSNVLRQYSKNPFYVIVVLFSLSNAAFFYFILFNLSTASLII